MNNIIIYPDNHTTTSLPHLLVFWSPCFWPLRVRGIHDVLITSSPLQTWSDGQCRGNEELGSGLRLVLFFPKSSSPAPFSFFLTVPSVFCLPLFLAWGSLSFPFAYTVKRQKRKVGVLSSFFSHSMIICSFVCANVYFLFLSPSHKFINWNIYSQEKCFQTSLLPTPQEVRTFPQREVTLGILRKAEA